MTASHLKLISAAALAVTLAPMASHASVFGTLGNFDVVNDTGSTAHGFEIDLEGLTSSDVTDTFGGPGRGFPTTVERYGSPTISDYGTGVRITYQSGITGGSWDVGTLSGAFNTPGESCWTGGGGNYPNIPCDHFGVGTSKNPTNTTYKWLVESSPGSLSLSPVIATVPAPTWTVTPPPPPPPGQPAPPPLVGALIPAPVVIPPPSPEAPDPQFGTPIWVKVFTTEYEHKVGLEDLVANSPLVPDENNGETEIEWQLMQFDPGNPNGGLNELNNEKEAGANAESVLRRYEFFKYIGVLSDDGAGEALCEDPTIGPACGPQSLFDPTLYGVGDFIGAQNAAVNLNGNPVIGPVVGVSEPETWALMLAGLGVVGRVGRRRSASSRK